MVTYLDRIVTRFVITPLAVIAAQVSGMNNLVFGGRLLVFSAITMCTWGIWVGGQTGMVNLVTAFALWFLLSVLAGSISEFVGSQAYRSDAHVTYAGKTTTQHHALLFVEAYQHAFLARLWRALLTIALVSVWVMAIQSPLLDDATVPFLVQFTIFWFFCYAPTVERVVIEPYLHL